MRLHSKSAFAAGLCAMMCGAPVNASAAVLAKSGYHARTELVSCRRHDGYINAWAAPYCIQKPRTAFHYGYYPSYWCPAYTVPGCYYPGYPTSQDWGN